MPIHIKRRHEVDSVKTEGENKSSNKAPIYIDTDLKTWAERYARNRKTSLEQIVTDFLFSLRDQEKGLEVEQI